MQQIQLGIFGAIVIAFLVCGCILTRRGRQISTKSDEASGQRGEATLTLATQTTAPHFSSWHPIGLKACRSVTQAIALVADEITCACPEKTQRGAKADRVTVDVQLKMGSRPCPVA